MMDSPSEIDTDRLEIAILQALVESPNKTVDPAMIARAIAGSHVDQWGPLMQPLRRAAIGMAKQGRVVIYRKGTIADPDDFKGPYKLGPVRYD